MIFIYRPSPQNALVRGLLTLATGALILALPGLTLKSVVMTIGAMILVNGLFSLLFSWWRNRKGRQTTSFSGIFNILLGMLFLLAPLAIVKFFGFFFGFLFLLLGFMQVSGALGMLGKSLWSWIYLAFALMMTFAGIFLLAKPIESAENVLTFFGVILVVYGFFELLTAWRLRKLPRQPGADNTVDTTYEEV